MAHMISCVKMIRLHGTDPRMGPRARSSIGVNPNGSQDGSKNAILDRGASKWVSGRVQRHDPRYGCVITGLRMGTRARSLIGVHPNGSQDGSNGTILGRGASKRVSGWVQGRDPR